MIIEIAVKNDRLGLKIGERYIAEPYWLDPEKVTLLKKISKGNKVFKNSNPSCNQYRAEVNIGDYGNHSFNDNGIVYRL